MSLSRKERQQLQREERNASPAPTLSSTPLVGSFAPKKSKLWLYLGAGAGVFFLLIAAATAYHLLSPGPYDEFSKCLSEKGAVMYGAMGWCKYTQGQKAMFGKSFKHVDYHEFTDYPNDLEEIKTTPTWIINGKIVENAQSLEELSRLSGCPLP